MDLSGVWFAWFMYLGNVPDWGCYFTMADGPGGPHGHEDCAHEQRRGMFDWLIGKADFMADQSYEVRLMRDWCGMWMRGVLQGASVRERPLLRGMLRPGQASHAAQNGR